MYWLPNYTCIICGNEITVSDNPYLCAQCMQQLPIMPEKLVGHYAPFAYEEPIRSLILQLKYSNNGAVAKALAPYLAAIYLKFIKTDQQHLIVPVPLHKSRQRERGYNQSLVLAQALAAYLQIPIVDKALVRTRKTTIQKSMDAATRAQNMHGAFTVLPEQVALIQQQPILLLDDVYTTGATAHACAQALYAAGAKRVDILTVAAVIS